MANQEHIQFRPKYLWRFLVVNRLDKDAKMYRISVEAETEREARDILVQHYGFITLLARQPVQEVHRG